MATEVATGLPLDNTDVVTSDEIIVIGSTDTVARKPVTRLINYINTQIGSLQRTFGVLAGNIATWAEGNNVDVVPIAKLPDYPTSKITNFNGDVDARVGTNVVRTVGNQTVDGIKNFTALRSNGQELFTTQFLSNTPTGVTLTGDFTSTGDVTLGASDIPITEFLQSIENAGGLTTRNYIGTGSAPFALGTPPVITAPDFVFLDNDRFVVADGDWINAQLFSPDVVFADGTYLFYINPNRWAIAEISTLRALNVFTNIISHIGTTPSVGDTLQIYDTSTSIDLLGFLDFYITLDATTSPVDFNGDTIVTLANGAANAPGATPGSYLFGIRFQSASDSYVIFAIDNTDNINLGDSIRMEVFPVGVDKATATPSIVTNVIVFRDEENSSSLFSGGFNTGQDLYILPTMAGADIAALAATQTTPLLPSPRDNWFFFTRDQVNLFLTTKIAATGLSNPANITIAGRTDTTELVVDGQTVLSGLPTVDPNITGQVFTQTGTELGLTGAAATQKFILQS